MEEATISDYARMCKHFDDDDCQECPLFHKQTETGLSCEGFIRNFPDKASEIILKWCEEHPIETRLSRFLKIFPNADRQPNGVSSIAPCKIDTNIECVQGMMGQPNCGKCKEKYWLEEIPKED